MLSLQLASCKPSLVQAAAPPSASEPWDVLVCERSSTVSRQSCCAQELGIQTCVVSGGGSLAPHLDDFFEAAQLPVLNGWGMTETSPVITCRRLLPGVPSANVRGSVGYTVPGTRVRCAAAHLLLRNILLRVEADLRALNAYCCKLALLLKANESEFSLVSRALSDTAQYGSGTARQQLSTTTLFNLSRAAPQRVRCMTAVGLHATRSRRHVHLQGGQAGQPRL